MRKSRRSENAKARRSLADPRYRGFSCPQVPLDAALVEALTTGHFSRVTVSFLSRFGEILDRRAPGVTSLLDGWLNGPIDFNTVWDSAFGKIRELLAPPPSGEDVDPHESSPGPSPGGDDDVVERATGVALRLLERGVSGSFSADLSRPTQLRWGRWILPVADGVEATSNGRRASVVISSGHATTRVSLERARSGWSADCATAVAVVDLGAGPVLVIPPDQEECLRQGHGHSPVPAAEITRAIGQLNAAIDLISRYAPAYLPWVQRVVRAVYPVTARLPQGFASGSFLHRPGMIFLASPMPTAVVAELLAHEASHQHFWLAALAGALDDRRNKNWEYFSPYVQKKRSLRMILMTYHAFANAVIFHRVCRAAGFVDPIGVARDQKFSSQFEPYERLLRESELTPLGNMIWKTVAAEEHARSPVNAPTPPGLLAQP